MRSSTARSFCLTSSVRTPTLRRLQGWLSSLILTLTFFQGCDSFNISPNNSPYHCRMFFHIGQNLTLWNGIDEELQVPQRSEGEGVLREGLWQSVHQQRGLFEAWGGLHLWTCSFLAGRVRLEGEGIDEHWASNESLVNLPHRTSTSSPQQCGSV